MSNQHTTGQREPCKDGFHPDQFYHLIDRNKGRLQVLHYASFGLKHERGEEAACLAWVLADVLTDLESIGNELETFYPDSPSA